MRPSVSAGRMIDTMLVRLCYSAFRCVLDGLCACRKPRPCRSRSIFVFVEDSAQSIASADVEPGNGVWIGDRRR